MTLAAKLANPQRRPKGPDCSVRTLLRTLPERESEAVQAALDNPAWTASALARLLTQEGHRVQDTTVRRHRRGDCLIWTGSRDQSGYGLIGIGNGETARAHRYAWEQQRGPIPEGVLLDHRDHCDPACCNVDHLRLASRTQNRRNLSGAQTNASSGVRNVHRHGDRWRVSIRKDGRLINFGTFATPEEAAPVAERARKELFGEFAGKG